MPYFFVLPLFALISVAAAASTTLAWLYRPLRPLFPFAWRTWLWATVGFLFANALLFAAFWMTLRLADTVSPESWPQKIVATIAAALAIVGPFAASASGMAGGAILGCFLAWRAQQAQKQSQTR